MRIVLVVLVAAMVAACSSSMPADEYADAVTTIAEEYVVESQNLSFDYQQSVEDGVRDIVDSGADDAAASAMDLVRSATVEYLAFLEDAMRRYAEALDDLDPPNEVRDAHDMHIDAVVAVVDAIPAARDQVSNAADLDQVQLAFTASGFADGQPRWTATCLQLEQAIRDTGNGANLRCTRPVEAP